MIELRGASRAHVGRIARRMREEDRIEVTALGHSPRDALLLGIAGSSFCLTAFVDNSPHAMIGVAPVCTMDGIGRPWMLGTDRVYSAGRELLGYGPRVIAEMHRRFRRLENVVSASNEKAIRLLGHWGFQIDDYPLSFGGVAFLPFWSERRV